MCTDGRLGSPRNNPYVSPGVITFKVILPQYCNSCQRSKSGDHFNLSLSATSVVDKAHLLVH